MFKALAGGDVYCCHELYNVPYEAGGAFRAGLAEGDGPETVYLEIQRDSESTPFRLFMKDDEAVAIAHVLNGAVWAKTVLREDETC